MTPELLPEVKARIRSRDYEAKRRAEIAGQPQFCPVAGEEVLMQANGVCLWCDTDHSLRSRLTNRELEGMQMLAAGRTRKTIAHRLEVSVTSVANDWRDIRFKLGAATTTQALVMLVREGSV